MKKQSAKRDTVDPTPTEIRRRCAQIQEGWSDRARAKRAGLVPTQWQPPQVPLDDMTVAILPSLVSDLG